MISDNLAKFLVYFVVLGLFFLWSLYVANSDPFDHYKEERNFRVVAHKKYKDPKKDYFMFVDGYDLIDRDTAMWDISFSNGSVKGLDSLYDYIEVGDTILKKKDSPILIVKNGVRKRVFVGASNKK